VVVKQRRDLGEFPEVLKAIRSVESKLAGSGRIFVRFSGTESKVRILVEGPDRSRNEQYAKEVAEVVTRSLNP
jgi:phosphoglucosamine mutase